MLSKRQRWTTRTASYSARGRPGENARQRGFRYSFPLGYLGAESPTVALSLNDLAYLYETQCKYIDSEPVLKRSLALNEKAVTLIHPIWPRVSIT